MSMYNMLFGENVNQKAFLFQVLTEFSGDPEQQIDEGYFGRYRDIYVTNDHIVVHTRNGGGNREWMDDVFLWAGQHPLYSYDEDDSFDCTYADIHFDHPPKYRELLQEMAKGTVTPSERWELLFKSLEA